MLSHYVKQDVDTEAYLICLFCRHKELGQAEECPKYKTSGGVTIGCTFADVPLPVFTDINFCLNGSSPEGPLKPTFASLQIQNHGKYISCSSFDSPLAQLWFDRGPQHLYTSLHAITIADFVFLCSWCIYAVKCAATKKLHLQTGPDKFELHWEHPDGKVPGHCLEYEVEHTQEGPDGKKPSVWFIQHVLCY